MAPIGDKITSQIAARSGFQAHAKGNRLLDAGRHEDAKPHLEKALREYEKALAHGSNNASVRTAYSLLLMRFGRMEEAKSIMEDLQRRENLSKEDKKQLLINLSVCRWKMGDLDAAIEGMRRAGEDGKTGAIYNTLGLFLVEKAEQTGDFAEAEAFLAEAEDYDDEDADTLDNIARLAWAQCLAAKAAGNSVEALEYQKKAEQYYDKTLKLRPNMVTALYGRAKMRAGLGDAKGALADAEKALNIPVGMLNPVSNADIEALIKSLKR